MINVSGKKITLMGLGLLGRGVNVAKFLLESGARLIITDLKSESELADSINSLKEHEDKIEYVLERHRIKDFVETDLVVKSAGVTLDNKYIQAARQNNIPIKMDASWCVSQLPEGVITIGVTGTKGKSTVTHLIEHILKTAGQNVRLGGNVRGRATLPLLSAIKSGDYLLLELDSWQLQGFDDEKISPNVAVFTNFMPDHLNYYKGMPEYYHDKSAIYRYQKKSDFLVLSQSSYEAWKEYDNDFKPLGTTAIVKQNILQKDWTFTQLGEHNRLNAAQAYQVAKFLKIEDPYIKEALETFGGVAGRLESRREVSKVTYYNDTNATTPEATAASVKAINAEYGPLVAIVGGVSKKFPNFDSLISALNNFSSHVVLLPGSIAESITPYLKVPISEVESMADAVQEAASQAQLVKSLAVLMSPAGSSFGLFKNEYDRGDQFNSAVESL